MKPTIMLDHAVLAVHHGRSVHLLVELTAPPAPPQQRPPLDLALVIDRSGSMNGAPLQAVTRAVADLVRLAGPEDRIAVVTFDEEVQLVLALDRHRDTAAAAARVRAVHSGGSTNLSAGWLKGFEVLAADRRPEALARVVVLTDGHANAGVTDRDRLAGFAAAGQKQGITTSCIGFDDGYDETLLGAIAAAGGGADYWCAGPDQAAAVFTDEFGRLGTVVAQNCSIELRPDPAVVTSYGVLDEYPAVGVPGGIQLALGDAYGGEQRRLVAHLDVGPMPSEGSVTVAEVVVRWVAVGPQVELHTITIPVTIEVGAGLDDVPPNPVVIEQVNILKAASRREEARKAADRGDFGTASELLHAAASMLEGTSVPAAEIAELHDDAVRLGHADWDATSSKRLYSRTREISTRRKTRFDDTTDPGDAGSGPTDAA